MENLKELSKDEMTSVDGGYMLGWSWSAFWRSAGIGVGVGAAGAAAYYAAA